MESSINTKATTAAFPCFEPLYTNQPSDKMADFNTVDVEKSKEPVVADWDDAESGTVEEIKAKQLQKKTGFLRTLRRGEEWLDAKLGVETQGIDRIPEEERHPPSIWNILFLWWSMNTHIANVPVGMLGPQFGLSFRQSIGASIGGIILGALCVGFTGTLGPKVSENPPYSDTPGI